MATATEDNVTCCYAVQDKVWVKDPDGAPWEVYTVLADAEVPAGASLQADPCAGGVCATPLPETDAEEAGAPRGCC